MKFSLATIVALVASVSAGVVNVDNLGGARRDTALLGRQNQNRPVPSGTCCVANTSLKQDACTSQSGAAGRCVPGGNNCGGRLSCVEQSNLECDQNVIERGNSLCRARAPGGGLFDGGNIIQSLADATVN
ncbi:hypothetical protein B0T11DRAFT_344506 [Plectosphaerella cucumerina]|uniref:Uncharacterized protein n=1 Tax=Plectosphaerella cucumerina TaxID=40658 RepID=A0A8K0TR34_9PEZI|nr:hypothetical protein B0T11DRAFT_344506 [Plectosphaerella cucumerina]